MNKRDSANLHQNPLFALTWETLLSAFDPEEQLRQILEGNLEAFYGELGWDVQVQADFFFETACVEKLSSDELVLLIDKEVETFVKKCHLLLLLLANSVKQQGPAK